MVCAASKNDLAIQYYNSAIEIKPNFIEPLYNKAMYLQETGIAIPNRYNEAIACYDQIISIDANAAIAYYNKGFIYLVYQKNYSQAVMEFTKAIEKNPQYAEAYYNRGLSYEYLRKNKEALAEDKRVGDGMERGDAYRDGQFKMKVVWSFKHNAQALR